MLTYHLPFVFAGSDRFRSSRLQNNQEHGRYLTRIVGPSATAWGKAGNFDSFDLFDFFNFDNFDFLQPTGENSMS